MLDKNSFTEIYNYTNNLYPQNFCMEREAIVLYLFARDVRDKYIVELGSFRGKSTIYLTYGGLAGGASGMFAVDMFVGTVNNSKYTKTFTENMYEDFCRNIQGAGLKEKVNIIKMDSTEAASKFDDNSVGLLYIDADHTYKKSKADFEVWYPKVCSGGYILMHDISWSEAGLVYKEMLERGLVTEVIKRVNMLGVLKKC